MRTKPKEFTIKVEGIPASRLKKCDTIIEIINYSKIKKETNIKNKIKYQKKEIEKHYSNKIIDPFVEDLMNIALATFSVDSIVPRTVNKSNFVSRNIRITIPVNDKEKWNKVKPILEQTISFMTYDTFKYKFIKRKCNKYNYKTNKASFDSIALFSGGLDSFAGSSFLISKNYKPLFLSINHGGIERVVKELHKSIPKIYEKIILGVNKKGIQTKEYTQFSRSFLYLTNAVALARAYNINKVFIPENGIIAFQIGFKEGRYGTRTTHPKYIRLFSLLINSLFPKWNLEIINPFLYKTKTEVVSLLKNKKELLRETISCGHSSRFEHSHCGMCFPCIIRRISLVLNGVYKDRISKYGKETFMIDLKDPRINKNLNYPTKLNKGYYRDGVVNILELINLTKDIKNLSDDKLIVKYPEMSVPKILELYKKFGSEIIKTIDYFKDKNKSLMEVY